MENDDDIILKLINNVDIHDKNNEFVVNFLKSVIEKKKTSELEQPSKLEIFVKSSKCNIIGNINTDKMVNIIDTIVENKSSKTIVGVIHDDVSIGELKCNKMKNNRKKTKEKNTEKFGNQITILLRIDENNDEKNVNVKFFKNKNNTSKNSITITGSVNDTDGYYALERFLNELKQYPEIFYSTNECKITDYCITMICAGYKIGFKVDQKKFYDLLRINYKLFISFDSTRYRGVIVGYMWNKNNELKDGLCKCENKCNYDKKLRKTNECKLITISIFQKGNIIITGSSDMEQAEEAYSFINNILYTNYSNIVNFSILDEEEKKKKKQKKEIDSLKGTKEKKEKKKKEYFYNTEIIYKKLKIKKNTI